MSEKNVSDIYLCKICKQEVIITKVGNGDLVCCGQLMTKVADQYDIEADEEDEEDEE